MNKIRVFFLALLCAVSIPAMAAKTVTVADPWVRATVPGQDVAGAFMEITSTKNAKLVKVTSQAAGTVEIHTMSMNNGVMEMRQIKSLDLPANQTVKLEPGAYHIMLFNLKHPFKAGTKIPLTLTVEQENHKKIKIEVEAKVIDQRGQ
jgi:copper(I)-binding protein